MIGMIAVGEQQLLSKGEGNESVVTAGLSVAACAADRQIYFTLSNDSRTEEPVQTHLSILQFSLKRSF